MDGSPAFLAFCTLSFRAVDSFLRGARFLGWRWSQSFIFLLLPGRLMSDPKKAIAKTDVKEIFPSVSFQNVYDFISYIEIFHPFSVDFLGWHPITAPLSSFACGGSTPRHHALVRQSPRRCVFPAPWLKTSGQCLRSFVSGLPVLFRGLFVYQIHTVWMSKSS